jgi:hypothetical protein
MSQAPIVFAWCQLTCNTRKRNVHGVVLGRSQLKQPASCCFLVGAHGKPIHQCCGRRLLQGCEVLLPVCWAGCGSEEGCEAGTTPTEHACNSTEMCS